MKTEKMILCRNWQERHQAEKLGMDVPEADVVFSKLLFWKKDLRRAMIDIDGSITLVMLDDTYIDVQYDEKLWKELEIYFMTNEDET